MSGTAAAQTAAVVGPASEDRLAGHVTEAAQRFRLPPAWIRAVIRVESAGNNRAVSSKGARGLMQIMPQTWDELRVRLRLGVDPFDPRDNILAGSAYLRELFDRYGSPGFLAAYNAGPARYESYLAGRPLPAETRAYVARLSPLVGGGPLGGSMPIALATQPALPRRWQESPLFVATARGVAQTLEALPQARSAVTAESLAARDAASITPHSNGLFIAGGPR